LDRKEAYIKASGDGLSAPARFIHIANDPIARDAWSLHDLQLDSNYAALSYPDTERPIVALPMLDPAEVAGIHGLRARSVNLP
jgi:hypothetical protein